MKRFAGLVAVLLLLGIVSAAAAKSHSLLSGVVTDATGAVVPGTKVTVTNERTKKSVVTTTSDIGRYEMKLKPGVYSISTEKLGFHPYRQTEISLSRREQRVVNIQMTIRIIIDIVETSPPQTQTAPVPAELPMPKPDR